MGGVSYLIGATFEALLHDGGAAGAADGAGEDPCGGAFKDDAQELPRHLGTATASDSGRFERVLSALYLPRLAKWLARPDDYSTSRIGRFNARSSRRSTPRIDL
jgi:hypothetical protein